MDKILIFLSTSISYVSVVDDLDGFGRIYPFICLYLYGYANKRVIIFRTNKVSFSFIVPTIISHFNSRFNFTLKLSYSNFL